MESVLRPLVAYLILLVFFRLAGKRSLASITPFDFVLLLIVAEAVQGALIGNDYSMTNAMLVVLTLIMIDIAFSIAGQHSAIFRRIIDDEPVILVDNGRVLDQRLSKARVSVDDILQSARFNHGLERLDQVRFAVLEIDGGISIVPKPEASGS